jgi:hypothetical protein
MFIAIFVALYEQSKEQSNMYIMGVCVIVFMFGMMKLSAKLPSKNQENSEEDDSERR